MTPPLSQGGKPMTDLREEIGQLLLPFLSDEMTFAQACILADQMIHAVRRREPETRAEFIHGRRA